MDATVKCPGAILLSVGKKTIPYITENYRKQRACGPEPGTLPYPPFTRQIQGIKAAEPSKRGFLRAMPPINLS